MTQIRKDGYIMFEIIKRESGYYGLFHNGKLYAIATKCTDNTWCYRDSTRIYHYPTLKMCKEHFKLINWDNGKKNVLPQDLFY